MVWFILFNVEYWSRKYISKGLKLLEICYHKVDVFSVHLMAYGIEFVSHVIILVWKKLIQCAFLALSFCGLFTLTLYQESPQETSKYTRNPKFRWCVQKHIAEIDLMWFYCVISLNEFLGFENQFEWANLVKANFQSFQTFINRPSWSILHGNENKKCHFKTN